jgi:glutamyl-tRNA reductase
LIRTTTGLASALIGDIKIADQVRAARKLALKHGYLRPGRLLDRLCLSALVHTASLPSAMASTHQYASEAATAGTVAGIHIEEQDRTIGCSSDTLIIGREAARDAAINVAHHRGQIIVCCPTVDQSLDIAIAATRAHPGRERQIETHSVEGSLLDRNALYDIIICTQPVRGAYLTKDDIKRIARKRRAFYAAKGHGDDHVEKLLVIDLTDGEGIDREAAQLDDVTFLDSSWLAKHFGSSMRKASEMIDAALEACVRIQTDYDELASERQIASIIRRVCREMDETERQIIDEINRDPEMTPQQKVHDARMTRKVIARRKHDRISEIREMAGLSVRTPALR